MAAPDLRAREPDRRDRTEWTAEQLAAMLAQRRADWLPSYFPAGKLGRAKFWLGDADGAPGRSLPIPLDPSVARFCDFTGDFSGDDLALLARAIGAGQDMGAAFKEALRFLGLADGATREPPPRAPAPPEPSAVERHRELAQEIWRAAHPLCACEDCRPGRIYLASRCITAWPEALQFHPACPFGRETAPAIVAPVNDSRTGYVVGVWRIRLTAAGRKVGRFGLGPTKGNASQLFWLDGDEVAVSEGIEDTLATTELTGVPCWAALSAGGMAGLILPKRLQRITVVADRDANGAGLEAAGYLARRLRSEGRDARIVMARHGKDANEELVAVKKRTAS